MVNEGYLYVAIGNQYIEEASFSAKSLKKRNAKAHITLITDKLRECDAFDDIIPIAFDLKEDINYKSGILFKVLGLLHSPYQKTFFVDSDTYFYDSCEELFSLLEYFDLLIAPDASDRSRVIINNKKLEGYIPYNTGIMVFNKTQKIDDLFKCWYESYKNKIAIYQQDQPAFIEALLSNPINLYALHPNYNLRLPCYTYVPNGFVKIVHGRSRNFEALGLEINRSISNRAWNPQKQRVIMIKNWKEKIWDLIPKRLKKIIKYF